MGTGSAEEAEGIRRASVDRTVDQVVGKRISHSSKFRVALNLFILMSGELLRLLQGRDPFSICLRVAAPPFVQIVLVR